MKLQLRFPAGQLAQEAEAYTYDKQGLEREIIDTMVPLVRARGHLTMPEFLKVCEWKTSRSKSRVIANHENDIQELTRLALSTPNELLRIGSLTLLHGVGWPTASVFLHLFHTDPYPILDFRALWSLGVDAPPSQYTVDYWWPYVEKCRDLSDQAGLDMRTVDRALWAYSAKNQKNTRA